jgi:DeoR/GlpR family transcriptional regulator of sugar metabolism
MAETTPRRAYLLAIINNIGTTVTTKHAVQIYANSPWRSASRDTARRDLRALSLAGYLVPLSVGGVRCYGLGDGPAYRPELRNTSRQQMLLHIVGLEGGEWTVGRVKALYRRTLGRHVYRSTIRRDLATLQAHGFLTRHGDGTPRCFYTPTARKDGRS